MSLYRFIYLFCKKYVSMKLQNKIVKIFADIIYLFLISFMCYTASNKLVNIDAFKTNLIKTTVFSINQAFYFSYFVIILEVVIILVLLFKKMSGLIIFFITILIFTLYISFLRFKGLYEVCGCGGVLNGLKYEYHLLINVGLMVGGLFCILVGRYEE